MSHSTPYGLGMDISDRSMMACLRGPESTVIEETTLPLSPAVAEVYLRRLKELQPVVALETGTHSNWIYDLLQTLGFEKVIMADARKLKVIFQSDKKTDRFDAQILARLAQTCPELLHGVRPRGEQARQDRRLLSARQIAVETRTKLVTHMRGIVKSTGARLVDCDADRFADQKDSLPDALQEILAPLFESVFQVTEAIFTYDAAIQKRCANDPVIKQLIQVPGVGEITALAFVSAIEDPFRFKRNRDVASYFGVRPRVDKSGMIEKQLRITKAGDQYMRQLLVQCAHAVLRPRSQVTDLKRWGQKVAESGGKRGKRRAAVAVARKLAVLLLSLWKTGAKYEPFKERGDKNESATTVPPKGSASSISAQYTTRRKRIRSPRAMATNLK